MEVVDMPNDQARWSQLDESTVRQRLVVWPDGISVVVPTDLLRALIAETDRARRAALFERRRALDAHGFAAGVIGQLLRIAGEAGVPVTSPGPLNNGIPVEVLADSIVEALRTHAMNAHGNREARVLLDALMSWGQQ